jgi:RNA polymerase primary sigma factor
MGRKYSNFESDESIVKYFKDVRKSVILTSEEEVELAIKIKNGDEKAIEKLINANLKFVVAIAKEYQGQGLSLADLISEGNYGLIKAANRFDYQRGFRFISYAVWWIKQSIIQSLNDNARMVRLPTNVINKIALLNKEISKFEFLNEREPVFGEIFDKEEEAINIVFYPKCGSLNEVINEDGDELIHLIPSEQIDENKLEINDRIKSELNKVLDILDEREKVIIENYFGINTNLEPMTLEAIGERYGLTKERIRQIKNKSLRKLRFSSEDLYKVINQVNN